MGERLPAEKALEWGLVNRVYDDAALMDETMKLARELEVEVELHGGESTSYVSVR